MSKSTQCDLTDRVAIVTGASRGLGYGMALALAHAGATVAVTSRTESALDGICGEVTRLDRRALPVRVDVTVEDDIRRMVDVVMDRLGRIDVLVNNAGCNIRKPALDLTWDDWDTVLDTNLKGMFFCSQAVAPHMLRQNSGRSSTSALPPVSAPIRRSMPTVPAGAAYCS